MSELDEFSLDEAMTPPMTPTDKRLRSRRRGTRAGLKKRLKMENSVDGGTPKALVRRQTSPDAASKEKKKKKKRSNSWKDMPDAPRNNLDTVTGIVDGECDKDMDFGTMAVIYKSGPIPNMHSNGCDATEVDILRRRVCELENELEVVKNELAAMKAKAA
jgi:hypothetical protein